MTRPDIPGRRRLHFDTLDEIVDDVRHLHESGYEILGQWTLGQCCDHLVAAMLIGLDGTDIRVNPLVRMIGWLLRKRIIESGFPAGVRIEGTPAATLLPQATEDDAGVAMLEACIQRAKAEPQRHPSPLLGKLTRDEWDRLSLRHAEHHLSFLVPTDGAQHPELDPDQDA